MLQSPPVYWYMLPHLGRILERKGITMKEFVEYIVKHLVDNPEEVKVSEVFGETTVVYEHSSCESRVTQCSLTQRRQTRNHGNLRIGGDVTVVK